MLKELLAHLWQNCHRTEHCSVRLTESITLSTEDSVLIKNGVFVWCALLSEKASVVLDESSFRAFGGRIRKYPAAVLTDEVGVARFLRTLDGANEIVTSVISSGSSEFKAQTLFSELHHFLSESSPDLWRFISPVLGSVCTGLLTRDDVSFLRQLFSLLLKLEIDRSDMLQELQDEFIEMEDILASEAVVQRAKSTRYVEFVALVRRMLHEVVEGFTFNARLCKHGPGAVSIPKVKGPVQKFLHMGYDSRIDYLLSKGSAGSMGDYSPFDLLETDRTSRLIFVPKTWKKLRGISAEPPGLQFFQQAVFRSVSDAINSTRLRHVVNLHDQARSRDLARRASFDGTLATIDLSSASDSVTLQLVKDIFGSSLLARWLLATRSTHTLVNDERLEINKFAPMGSACCFPVECLIFAGIALATAAESGERHSLNDFRVFGDDIICPTSIAQDVMDNLCLLGFTVNTDKSFVDGDFRESCGMDAWRGFDVTPLKLKDFSFDFDGSKPLPYEHHSRIVEYLNSLYFRGFSKTRSFLLEKLSSSTIALGGKKVSAAMSIRYGCGEPGTVFSPTPTNFHLSMESLKGFQRFGYKMLVYRPRFRKASPIEESLQDEVAYFTWLMTKSSDTDAPVSYGLEFFKRISTPSRDTQGMQMIPVFRVVDLKD